MREIKFRAWDTKKKIMMTEKNCLYFQMDFSGTIREMYWTNKDLMLDGSPTKKPLIVMQFINLRDKNGVEIYENDVVNWTQAPGGLLPPDSRSYLCQIIWERTGWACKHLYSESRFTLASSHIKLLGNIYENPELLQSEKDKI